MNQNERSLFAPSQFVDFIQGPLNILTMSITNPLVQAFVHFPRSCGVFFLAILYIVLSASPSGAASPNEEVSSGRSGFSLTRTEPAQLPTVDYVAVPRSSGTGRRPGWRRRGCHRQSADHRIIQRATRSFHRRAGGHCSSVDFAAARHGGSGGHGGAPPLSRRVWAGGSRRRSGGAIRARLLLRTQPGGQ